MIHPLAGDLRHLKDSEIELKIQDLSKKYFQTHNSNLQKEIILYLDVYRQELSARRVKSLQDEYQKRDKDLDSLINID